MFPSTIILEPSKIQQQKTLVLRNTTNNGLIVKLISSSNCLKLDRSSLALEAYKMIKVSAIFAIQDVGFCSRQPHLEISIYARPVTCANAGELRAWLQSNEKEKRLHRAFKLTAQVTDSDFSASDIVLDLPGNALEMAHFDEEADIKTAGQLEKKSVETKEDKEETCGIIKKWMDTIYPSKTPKATPI